MAVLKREEVPSTQLNVHDVHTILGPESTFEGKLIFEGTVRIDGQFRGEIHTEGTLIVGQTAKISAQLHVGHIAVHGQIVGDITAQHLIEIHAPASVRGNISAPALMIARGVIFEGTSKMEQAQHTAHASAPGTVTRLNPAREDTT